MSVTIKDIAAETGLSPATVSKYLNNKSISKENFEKIRNAVVRLDYTPNQRARRLRSKKTMTVCVLISDIGNYFWSPVVNAITGFFMKHNYTVVTFAYYFDENREMDVIRYMISQNADGVIMLPNHSQDNLYSKFQEAGIPVVLIDQVPEEIETWPTDCIVSDNYGGGAMLARELYDKGHRNVYIMSSAEKSYTVKQRVKSFIDVYQKHGVNLMESCPANAEWVSIRFTGTEQVRKKEKNRFRQIMSSENPPTAVFFTNYISAMGGISALASMGLRVPEDVSLVCFDDDLLFQAMSVPMTCVAQNLIRVGEKASELLLRRMKGEWDGFPQIVMDKVDFHIRKSVKRLNP